MREKVTARHPETGARATFTNRQFERIYAARGWEIEPAAEAAEPAVQPRAKRTPKIDTSAQGVTLNG